MITQKTVAGLYTVRSNVNTESSRPQPPSADLIERYFIGKCTDAEGEQVRSWIDQFKNGPAALQALREVRGANTPDSWDIDTHWTDFQMRIREDQASTTSTTSARVPSAAPSSTVAGHRRPSSKIWWALMGSLGTLAVLFFGWQSRDRQLQQHLAQQASVYTTANGERASVTLPDGSTVMLNVASQLTVPADYAMGNRTLWLSGEAIFDVVHHVKAPFVVVAGPSQTRVLGTKFLVRYYDTDTSATIAVREGKVAVQDHILTVDEALSVSPHAISAVRPAAPTLFSFSQSVLTLDGIPLKEAIPDLNRWFDADVRLGDPALASRLIAGEYVAGFAANLAEILQWTFNVTVVREGRVLTLYPKQ